MKILVTAAEREELDCAIAAYGELKEKIGETVEMVFKLTGIGATQACYTVTRETMQGVVDGKPYNLVVNIGIAGSYNMEKFPMGSAAIIEREYFGDLGFKTEKGFTDLFQYGILGKDDFPYTNGALERRPLPYANVENALQKYGKGTGVTVQCVTGDSETTRSLIDKYSPHIESMEGAAVYFVSLMANIPFFELRTVSNEVGEKDKGKWDIPAALASLHRCCLEIFESLHTL